MEVYNDDRKVICRSAPSIFKLQKTNLLIFPKTVFVHFSEFLDAGVEIENTKVLLSFCCASNVYLTSRGVPKVFPPGGSKVEIFFRLNWTCGILKHTYSSS